MDPFPAVHLWQQCVTSIHPSNWKKFHRRNHFHFFILLLDIISDIFQKLRERNPYCYFFSRFFFQKMSKLDQTLSVKEEKENSLPRTSSLSSTFQNVFISTFYGGMLFCKTFDFMIFPATPLTGKKIQKSG